MDRRLFKPKKDDPEGVAGSCGSQRGGIGQRCYGKGLVIIRICVGDDSLPLYFRCKTQIEFRLDTEMSKFEGIQCFQPVRVVHVHWETTNSICICFNSPGSNPMVRESSRKSTVISTEPS